MPDLFSPYTLGGLALKNRIVMAPMTRCRAIAGDVPNPISVTYYTQRASAGLIITEGSPVSRQGVGFIRTPGIYTEAQVEGWRTITNAVHAAGSKIYVQLWHTGRVSHPDFHDGTLPVAPSAIPFRDELHTATGKKPIPVPRELRIDEIPGIVEEFRRGAENAKAAGFDGAEIHGANGYLPDQFLRANSNHRTDAYGGTPENRMRFPLEVTDAVARVLGPDWVGYRISPHFTLHEMSDPDPRGLFTRFAKELSERKIGYIHLEEPRGGRMGFTPPKDRLGPAIRDIFKGTLMVNAGYDAPSGHEAIASGAADLVSYGSSFLANPDLPERFRRNAPLNDIDITTFYSGEEKGYTDYPFIKT
jgi:N-ethylmaleimide reductase